MGGGNRVRWPPTPAPLGLSPRGRGKPAWSCLSCSTARSIPAWAGETCLPAPSLRADRVYPRVGGGNLPYPAAASALVGLSPRGRGKRLPPAYRPAGARSIPAWAGETPSLMRRALKCAVYPRVGGGNPARSGRQVWREGLSPRGRGKPRALCRRTGRGRSIPAWAGETGRLFAQPFAHAVYPRVGGGNRIGVVCAALYSGLSPRGRGKRHAAHLGLAPTRSIPAWAGETNATSAGATPPRVYPRVGGGNTGHIHHAANDRGLSPRGRGKLPTLSRRLTGHRSIPAWAGETGSHSAKQWTSRVYPRVGGGNLSDCDTMPARAGLSPRGRGKRAKIGCRTARLGSIPAWAGETAANTAPLASVSVYPRVGGGNAAIGR